MNKEILVVEKISKTFGRKGSTHSVLALDNITFTMDSGANALLGPNGAGKSTLIKILLGFLKADSGTAQLLGFDIRKEWQDIRARIGYMPEHFTIIPGINAVKQVSLLAKTSGLPNAEAMQRSHETLQYVGLGESRYRKVNEFSTGMLQRLKLAQSLVHDPELLILDEPTNGLDPKGRLEMIDLIREISREHDINMLVSSHLLPDIEATCELATILNLGKVVAQGNIAELTGKESRSFEQRIMNVTIKGKLDDFLKGLQDVGLSFTVIDRVIQIPYTTEDISHTIVKVAYDTKVQIRTINPRKAILEDVFVHSIEDGLLEANPTGTKTSGGN
jgi:ABC-2 type transport system ATP-binding protein